MRWLAFALFFLATGSQIYLEAWDAAIGNAVANGWNRPALPFFVVAFGLGAFAAGRGAHSLKQPLFAFATATAAAAVLALTLALNFDALLAWHSRQPLAGLLQLAHLAALSLPFVPFGAALALMLEYAERQGAGNGSWQVRAQRLTLSYGVNGLGCVLGLVFARSWALPELGYKATLLVGAAAVFATSVLTVAISIGRERHLVVRTRVRENELGANTLLAAASATLAGAIGGAAARLSSELASGMLPCTGITDALAATVPGGTVLGALLTLTIIHRAEGVIGERGLSWVAGLLGSAALTLATLPLFMHALISAWVLSTDIAVSNSLIAALLTLVLLPAAALGAILPLLVVSLHARRTAPALGALWLVSSFGTVVGHLVLGFMLPHLGLSKTLFVLIGLAATMSGGLWLRGRGLAFAAVWFAALALGGRALVLAAPRGALAAASSSEQSHPTNKGAGAAAPRNVFGHDPCAGLNKGSGLLP